MATDETTTESGAPTDQNWGTLPATYAAKFDAWPASLGAAETFFN